MWDYYGLNPEQDYKLRSNMGGAGHGSSCIMFYICQTYNRIW